MRKKVEGTIHCYRVLNMYMYVTPAPVVGVVRPGVGVGGFESEKFFFCYQVNPYMKPVD